MVLVGCIPFPEHSCRPTLFGTFCIPTRAPIEEGDFEEFFADPALNRETVLLQLGEPDLILQNGTAFLYYWRMYLGYQSFQLVPIGSVLHRRHALLFVFDTHGVFKRLEKEESFNTSWKQIEDWVQSVLPLLNQPGG